MKKKKKITLATSVHSFLRSIPVKHIYNDLAKWISQKG